MCQVLLIRTYLFIHCSPGSGCCMEITGPRSFQHYPCWVYARSPDGTQRVLTVWSKYLRAKPIRKLTQVVVAVKILTMAALGSAPPTGQCNYREHHCCVPRDLLTSSRRGGSSSTLGYVHSGHVPFGAFIKGVNIDYLAIDGCNSISVTDSPLVRTWPSPAYSARVCSVYNLFDMFT
jgi:hypothetical protein